MNLTVSGAQTVGGGAGLAATKYEGYFADNLNFFSTATKQTDSRFSSLFTAINTSTPGVNFDETYSVEWQGYFKASATGTHTFYTNSDDSSWLWLGSQGDTVSSLIGARSTSNAVVNNSGLHGTREVSGTIDLVAGKLYPILVYFGENTGGDQITVSFTPPGGTKSSDGSSHYLSGGAGVDTLSNIENLTGSDFADTLTGDSGCLLYTSDAADE